MSTIDPRLWQAYQNVCFCFENETLFASFAVITAWNPKSIRLSDSENCVNNLRLQQTIANYDWSRVRVGDPRFEWFEDSFAVEMPLAAALQLATEFGQNAIYYVSDGELWLHACAPHQAYCLGPLRDNSYLKTNSHKTHNLKTNNHNKPNKNHGGMMRDITPDICDKYQSKVTLLELPLQNFGMRSAFWGEIVTVRCYHDNSKVKEVLSRNGKGKVLVVDGHGSCRKALMGDQIAISAIENEWEGVIINGAVRDVVTMSQIDLGIKALAACPFKTEKCGAGDINVSLNIHNQMIHPGDYIYADWNGVLISQHELDLSAL